MKREDLNKVLELFRAGVLGRSHSYLQQFLMRWTPRNLPEDVRPKLAELLDVSDDQLRG